MTYYFTKKNLTEKYLSFTLKIRKKYTRGKTAKYVRKTPNTTTTVKVTLLKGFGFNYQ